MTKETKRWKVEFDYKDGRKGTVEFITEVGESDGFRYGNGKYGALIDGNFEQANDLRYVPANDLHRVILNEYFGDGLVKAEEL